MATNRRNVLKRGVSPIGTAAAVAVAGRSANASEVEVASSAKPVTGLTLHGRAWRIASRDVERGVLPPVGVRMLTRGELVDKPVKGRKVANFFATYHRLSAPGKVASHEPGSLELHTFVFSDGTIIGSGIASAASESEGHFAIVGGTGKYLGVKGAYVATQRHTELGGDGTATFTFTFV